MEQIFVESNKTYTHGFLLKEQDLRRIVALFNEQFKKVSVQQVIYEFTLKFANGAIATTQEIETVLNQENEGSSSIQRLEIKATQENDNKITQIKLEFENIDSYEIYDRYPIKHNIKGQSRDWVFVTSSLIEERIAKIKKLNTIFNYGLGKVLVLISMIMVVALIVLVGDFFKTDSSIESYLKREILINKIDAEWKAHKITDPIDVILQLEKSKNATELNKYRNGDTSLYFKKPFWILTGLVILIYIYLYLLSIYNPTFNFYWGNYIEIYNKKENIRKLLIGLFVGTILLGVVVNLISNYIWEKI